MEDLMQTSRYDRPTMFFHWATAVLVAEQWLGAQTIDWFPRGPLRVDARSVHITLGVALGLLLLARIWWRATRGRHLPPAERNMLHVLAKGTHWGLYLLLLAMVSVGAFLVWTRGDSIFGLFDIPAYKPGDRGLVNQVESIHATIGWIIVGLAGFHAAAALAHQYVWHDQVLTRMLPGTLFRTAR